MENAEAVANPTLSYETNSLKKSTVIIWNRASMWERWVKIMLTLQCSGFGWYSYQQENRCSDDISWKKKCTIWINKSLVSQPSSAQIRLEMFTCMETASVILSLLEKGLYIFCSSSIYSLTQFWCLYTHHFDTAVLVCLLFCWYFLDI